MKLTLRISLDYKDWNLFTPALEVMSQWINVLLTRINHAICWSSLRRRLLIQKIKVSLCLEWRIGQASGTTNYHARTPNLWEVDSCLLLAEHVKFFRIIDPACKRETLEQNLDSDHFSSVSLSCVVWSNKDLRVWHIRLSNAQRNTCKNSNFSTTVTIWTYKDIAIYLKITDDKKLTPTRMILLIGTRSERYKCTEWGLWKAFRLLALTSPLKKQNIRDTNTPWKWTVAWCQWNQR